MTGSFNVQLELAESGEVDACYLVGCAYVDGGNVVQKNRLEAAKWFHQHPTEDIHRPSQNSLRFGFYY